MSMPPVSAHMLSSVAAPAGAPGLTTNAAPALSTTSPAATHAPVANSSTLNTPAANINSAAAARIQGTPPAANVSLRTAAGNIGTAAGVGALLIYADREILGQAVKDGKISNGTRNGIMLTASLALGSATPGGLASGFEGAFSFLGFKSLAQMASVGLGADANSTKTQVLSTATAGSLYAALRIYAPEALEASIIGKTAFGRTMPRIGTLGVELAGASAKAAAEGTAAKLGTSGAEIAATGAKVATARLSAAAVAGLTAVRALGIVTLADPLARGSLYLIGNAYSADDREQQTWNLVRASQDEYVRRHYNNAATTVFATGLSAYDGIANSISKTMSALTDFSAGEANAQTAYEQELVAIQRERIGMAKIFHQGMEESISIIIAQNTKNQNGQSLADGNLILSPELALQEGWTTDWVAVERDLKNFYQNPGEDATAEDIRAGYGLVLNEAAPFLPDTAVTLFTALDDKGNVISREELLETVLVSSGRKSFENRKEFAANADAVGLANQDPLLAKLAAVDYKGQAALDDPESVRRQQQDDMDFLMGSEGLEAGSLATLSDEQIRFLMDEPTKTSETEFVRLTVLQHILKNTLTTEYGRTFEI